MNFFDLHCDTAFEMNKHKLDLNSDQLAVNFNAAKLFENWTQTFAIWIRDDLEFPLKYYCKIIEKLKNEMLNKPRNLKPILAVEGGALLEKNIKRVEILANDGIKFLTLTWNGENCIAGGINSSKGLTDFGKEVIKELNKYKIGCDLSHLNQKSFYKVLEYADYPLATHSNSFELCPHPRNLKLEQISLIAQKDGIIGLTFYPEFLNGDVFEAIYENIYFLCERGFQNNIAFGSDFDGAMMSDKLKNTEDILTLFEYLLAKGLKKDLLNQIFYENAQNYIAKL